MSFAVIQNVTNFTVTTGSGSPVVFQVQTGNVSLIQLNGSTTLSSIPDTSGTQAYLLGADSTGQYLRKITNIYGTNTGDQTITLTGDVTGSGTGTFTTTLASTGVVPGSYGGSSAIPILTVNAKGQVTTIASGTYLGSALGGTSLAGGIVTSSLTSTGTLTSGSAASGFTVADACLSSNVPLKNAANSFTAANSIAPIAATGSPNPSLTLTGPAHTSLTASTEINGANLNFSATKTWATGNITTQREILIQGPTYAFAAASTITTANTVAITAPTPGTNATFTNAAALQLSANIYSTGLTISAASNANSSYYSLKILANSGTLTMGFKDNQQLIIPTPGSLSCDNWYDANSNRTYVTLNTGGTPARAFQIGNQQSSYIAATIKLAASQSGDAFQVINNSGTILTGITSNGSVYLQGNGLYMKLPSMTVSNLTSASTAGFGSVACVTDATSTTTGTTVVGGGSNSVYVRSNGTNWIIF